MTPKFGLGSTSIDGCKKSTIVKGIYIQMHIFLNRKKRTVP